MKIILQFLYYGGVLLFTLWLSAILKGIMNLDYSSFFKENALIGVHNVINSLAKLFPGYFIGAVVPMVFLILGAVLGLTYEVPLPQIKIQIILLAVIVAAVGVVWDVVLLSYASIFTKKFWSFFFLSIDFFVVAVPLVLLLNSLSEARLSKAFLFSLPGIVLASFLAKAAYALSDFSD